MLTVTVTNLTSEELSLDDNYARMGAAGSSTASLTFTATAAQLDQMENLKELLSDGKVSLSIAKGANDIDLLTINLTQQGTVTGMAVDAVAAVTQAVIFGKPFPGIPNIQLTMVRGAETDWEGEVYVRSLTANGFTLELNVTTASGSAGAKANVCWRASY